MQQASGLCGEHLLGLVDLGPVKLLKPGDLVERQQGEQAQEAANVGVLGVAPELPIVVGRQKGRIEPDRARRVLPILAPDAVVISGAVRA